MKGLRLLLIICGLLLLTSCGQNRQTEETTDWTPLQIAQAVLESQPELPPMTAILAGTELYDTYIDEYYRFDPSDIADGVIFCADAASAQEIAILRLAESADINQAKQIFSDYSQRRVGAFTGYLPDEAALAENASIVAQGDMIALLICQRPELAEDTFRRAFIESPPDDKGNVSKIIENGPEYTNADDDIGFEEPVSSSEEPTAILQETEIDTSSVPDFDPGVVSTDTMDAEQEDTLADTTEPEPEVVPTNTMEPEPEVVPTNTMEPEPEVPPATFTESEPEPVPEAPKEIEPESVQTDTSSETADPSQSDQTESAPWSYSSVRLLNAWRLGDWSGLAQQDQEILNACQAVIGGSGFDALTDYEKELAVHDWMLENGRYDTNRLSNLPQYQENPDNDNPYGFLVGGVGICRGYTATFQLFMDLLGIECISIQGQANSTREEHAWNMVRLDGEWYCVDVTWDDPTTNHPVSAQTAHRYFNVTSASMRSTGHYWDESSVPDAFGTSLAWNDSSSGILT